MYHPRLHAYLEASLEICLRSWLDPSDLAEQNRADGVDLLRLAFLDPSLEGLSDPLSGE